MKTRKNREEHSTISLGVISSESRAHSYTNTIIIQIYVLGSVEEAEFPFGLLNKGNKN